MLPLFACEQYSHPNLCSMADNRNDGLLQDPPPHKNQLSHELLVTIVHMVLPVLGHISSICSAKSASSCHLDILTIEEQGGNNTYSVALTILEQNWQHAFLVSFGNRQVV